jgi:exo-beta-1,3-glucanase (GH17 family)
MRSEKISSLLAKQAYNWHVRAKCNGKWTSHSSTISFKTSGSSFSSTVSSAIAANSSTLRLYPNPSNGQFIVELHLAEKINAGAKIQLIDMRGKTVRTENAEVNNGSLQKTMNVSPSLVKGIYLTRIVVNDKVYTMKLVYEK